MPYKVFGILQSIYPLPYTQVPDTLIMVSDTRISPLLNRLGGLYRDPNRVDRDASFLLKSGVGKHLTPTISSLFENNGDTSNTLCLQGTIGILFRGQEYQQLVDIYLPPGYPNRPPVCYVRIASPNMHLKENHPHVGSDGQVYLPYLHEWKADTHTLIELVVAMSSVFSALPPVFTHAASTSTSSSSTTTATTTFATTTTSLGKTQSERDAVMQVQEHIAIVESRREAEQRLAEEEEARQLAAQQEWDAKNFSSTKESVRREIYSYLTEESRRVQQLIQADMMDQKQLALSEEKLMTQMQFLKDAKVTLEEQHAGADKALVDINACIQDAQQRATQEVEMSVDDRIRPVSAVDAQMLQLSADNASYSDALYFLDMALHNRVIELSAHLKEVRNLAKKQFMARAHLLKISQSRLQNGR